MKTFLRSAALVAALALSSVASASLVTMYQGAYQSGSGGEFQAVPGAGGGAGQTGLDADLSHGSFQTFCIETNEYIEFGHTYNAVINTAAVGGGSGGGHPDPLDARTAYLYWNFRMGTLAGYDYDGDRTHSAKDLQKAIWYIEGESGGKNNSFVTLATNAVNSGQWSGLGNVRVLNMTTLGGDAAQDQLTIVPAPAALVLGAVGLLGAFWAKRKLA